MNNDIEDKVPETKFQSEYESIDKKLDVNQDLSTRDDDRSNIAPLNSVYEAVDDYSKNEHSHLTYPN